MFSSSTWPLYINKGLGNVQVMAWADTYSTADFDSGWLSFNSQSGASSYMEVFHNFGVVPGRVKVLVQATSGANSGMIFHAMGAAQNDDTSGNTYGGVIYAYNANSVISLSLSLLFSFVFEDHPFTNMDFASVFAFIVILHYSQVRLWAPNKHSGSTTTGYIINIVNGWGGETNTQQ